MDKPAKGILKLPYSLDVSEITKYVNSLTDVDWTRWRLRQTLPNHEHTYSIKALWVPLDVHLFSMSRIEKTEPYFTDLTKLLGDCTDFLKSYYDGEIFKIILVKLAPNSHIKPHEDVGSSLEDPHRVHIPIITNPDIKFGCGETELYMEPGNLYEIDNQQKHYVINKTDQSRVHLIIDIIEKTHIQK